MLSLEVTDADETCASACGEDACRSRSTFTEVDSFPNATDLLFFALSSPKAFEDALLSIASLLDAVSWILLCACVCMEVLSHVGSYEGNNNVTMASNGTNGQRLLLFYHTLYFLHLIVCCGRVG